MSTLLSRETTHFTGDGFISHQDGTLEEGVETITCTPLVSFDVPVNSEFDVIIVGGGFAGLICARELSHRNLRVLIIEARDRIGGRAFTAEYEKQRFDLGGTAIHWNQPHLWSEITRYGLTIEECQGASAERVTLLLDNASRLKVTSMSELRPKIEKILTEYSNVDNVQGRTVIPMPQNPLAAIDAVQKFDHLSIQDRFNQISHLFTNHDDDNDEEMRQLIAALLTINVQADMATGGFIDHLCSWAHGNYQANTRSDVGCRYKLAEGMSSLAQAILDDCRDVRLLLSTPIVSLHSTDQQVTLHTSTGQLFRSRVAVITVPLNVLNTLHFHPPLSPEKQRVITQGQGRGGVKFWAKLEQPVGPWCGYAPFPNPITAASTEDLEGSMIVAYGPDDRLNIRDVNAVEHELNKFLPGCRVKFVIGHDWRKDPFVRGTWSWYRPGQMSASLRALQAAEGSIFFASADWSSGWKGCIDGALERGLAAVRDILRHLKQQRVEN